MVDTFANDKKWPKKPIARDNPDIPPHGWLLHVLYWVETECWGRWEHWLKVIQNGNVLDEPIPQIEFDPHSAAPVRKMHENALNSITRSGGWEGWGSWDLFNYYLDWLLYGFGHPGQKEPPKEPDRGAFDRLYQTYCLDIMIARPADVFGDLMAENRHGRGRGFYPTPHNVSEMMARMLMEGDDCRFKTVCDPCVGTGRLILHASNYSYRLFAQDVDETVIKAALVNGYCFAPWLVRPFFDNAKSSSAELSDSLTEQAPPHAVEYLKGTEHDGENQYLFEPIKKRRKKGEPEIQQGLLFKNFGEHGR
ncbi:N-6 DNA methylase [Cerasicoccus frondis]|uniref:N-6 DNA methylase n=1 Tax=Cerasicoccus frondis TaxID=490090 RepID=UPI002852ADC5|nr:N-6 DNA methylase [Cerasicoccus frondis]